MFYYSCARSVICSSTSFVKYLDGQLERIHARLRGNHIVDML